MWNHRWLIIFCVFIKWAKGLDKCCDELLVSSSGPAEEYQADRLGVYKQLQNSELNGKPLYRKVDGDDYFYFWKWDQQDGGGHNWLIR